MIRSRKKFWIFIIVVALIYGGLFFFIRSQISGSFALEDIPGKTITSEAITFRDLPDVITLNINEPYYLKIDHELGYSFSDNTQLFDINPTTGEISFTPTESGINYVVIIATGDDFTNFQAKPMIFDVVRS